MLASAMAAVGTSQQSAGTVVAGKYRLARKLGEGAFGEVWLSEDIAARTDVVVKVLHTQWSRVPSVVERFKREAMASQRIHHPSACRVFDSGVTEEGTPFIIMEYLGGGTLKDELVRVGRMPLARVAAWMAPVCEAVEVAHKAGIVHRDLKPENIMMKRQGESEVPVVVDFGIAKLLDADQKLTMTGSILGSPTYMSPEQCRGQSDIGPAADVYSLAIIVFELCVGRPPFVTRSFAEMAVKHAYDPAPPLTGVPPALAEMVARCFAKAPADRPPVAQLGRALRKAAAVEQRDRSPGMAQGSDRSDRADQLARADRAPGAPQTDQLRAVDSHSAPTMMSSGNKEVEEAMRRLKAPAQTRSKVNPFLVAGAAVLLAAIGALLGWLIH